MALQNAANLTYRQAIKRGAPVWNFRSTNWGNYTSGITPGSADLNSYPLFPPAYSVNGFAIAPDSTARQALIRWEPAGLPQADIGGGIAPWTTRGSRFLLTKDAPLLFPLQGRISILPFAEDMYTDEYTDLDGVVQPFGSALGSRLFVQPFISIYCFLRVPAAPVGPRRDQASQWVAMAIPGSGDDEGIVEIIPAHGRRSARFCFISDGAAPDNITVRVTGLVGNAGPGLANGIHEVVLPQLQAQVLPLGGGELTMEGAINCQYLVVRVRSNGAAATTGLYQYELRDSAGCCDAFANTGVPT